MTLSLEEEKNELIALNSHIISAYGNIARRLSQGKYIDKNIQQIILKDNELTFYYGQPIEKKFQISDFLAPADNFFDDSLPSESYFDMTSIFEKYHDLPEDRIYLFYQWKNILKNILNYINHFFKGTDREILDHLGIDDNTSNYYFLKERYNAIFFTDLDFELDLTKGSRKPLMRLLETIRENYTLEKMTQPEPEQGGGNVDTHTGGTEINNSVDNNSGNNNIGNNDPNIDNTETSDINRYHLGLTLNTLQMRTGPIENAIGYSIKSLKDIVIKNIYIPVIPLKEISTAYLFVYDSWRKRIYKKKYDYKYKNDNKEIGVFKDLNLTMPAGRTNWFLFYMHPKMGHIFYQSGPECKERKINDIIQINSICNRNMKVRIAAGQEIMQLSYPNDFGVGTWIDMQIDWADSA
jgi:hypothetical protein